MINLLKKEIGGNTMITELVTVSLEDDKIKNQQNRLTCSRYNVYCIRINIKPNIK